MWFEASYDLNNKTGWLGRWIDRYGDPNNPLQAISIDSALSKSIRTADKPVCAITAVPMERFQAQRRQYQCHTAGGNGTTDLNAAINSLAGVRPARTTPIWAARAATYGLAYKTCGEGREPAGPAGHPVNVGYPNNNTLSTRLRTAAHLLKAPLGTRVITIHWGGFDTHTNQLNGQDSQLKELSRALGAFQKDLKAAGSRIASRRSCSRSSAAA